MRPFHAVTSAVAVLDRTDVDTDQIIPKQFLKRITRTGFGEFLFFDWRFDEDGRPRPDFELNDARAAGAEILLTGANFGCGSSREHAAWALEDYGFRAVLAPSFGDIFRINSLKTGLAPIRLPAEALAEIEAALESENRLTVDLERQVVSHPLGLELSFEFDPFERHTLLEGLDEVARTMQREAEISAYEAGHGPRVDTLALVG